MAQRSIADFFKRSGNNSEIVIKAVKPALSIVRQQYRLERNGEYFGKKDKPYYGESYSLGIKISNGTLIQHTVLFPWKYDADYKRANSSGKYAPVYFITKQKSLNDSVYTDVDFELYSNEYVVPVTQDSSLFVHLDKMNDFGLSAGDGEDYKSGFLIWARANSETRDSALSVSLECSTLRIDSLLDDNTVKVNLDNLDKVIGGLYVVPIYEKVGEIRFALRGVISKREDSDWLLYLFLKDSNKKKNGTKVDKPNEEEPDDITPIKQR